MKAIYSEEEALQRDKESKQRHYLRNREEIIKRAGVRKKAQRERNRLFIIEYKKSHHCKCGESRFYCLDFHHKDPSTKDRCIKTMSQAPVSFKKLKEEIGKCIIVCSNCHKKLHFPSRDREWHSVDKRKNDARLFVWERKKDSVCRCGEDHPSCLDFHHEKGDKEKNVSKLAKDGYALKTIQAEIDKCVVVCSNCHREIHNGELSL